jgi:hypothetical protein
MAAMAVCTSACAPATRSQSPPPATEAAPSTRATLEPAATRTEENTLDGRKICRLNLCDHRILFVGDPPGGWSGKLEASVCFGEHCRTSQVDLTELSATKTTQGQSGIFFFAARPDGCVDDCVEFQAALDRVPFTGLKLVIGGFPPNTNHTRIVVLTLRRAGRTVHTLERHVTFGESEDSQHCYRPNGAGCEPLCCDAAYEF